MIAPLYGAFLTVADRLRGEERSNTLALWQRKGKRAFEAEQLERESSPRNRQSHEVMKAND